MIFHYIEAGTGQVVEIHAPTPQKAADILAKRFLFVADDFLDVGETVDGVMVYLEKDFLDAMLIKPISESLYYYKIVSYETVKRYKRQVGRMKSGRFFVEGIIFEPTIWEAKD